MEGITWPQRLAAGAAHASWLIGGFFAVWLPLLLWLLYRKNAFVRPHAKQALAWQLLSIAFVGAVAVAVVLAGLADHDDDMVMATVIFCIAVLPSVIFAVIGTVKALACEPYGYPLVKRLIESGGEGKERI